MSWLVVADVTGVGQYFDLTMQHPTSTAFPSENLNMLVEQRVYQFVVNERDFLVSTPTQQAKSLIR